MNAALQTLLNNKHIIEIFNSELFINYKNNISFGRIAESFRDLYKQKLESEDFVSPLQLKRLIGEFNDQFRDFDQQDSFEFLLFLINCLHEDLNLVTNRVKCLTPEFNDVNNDKVLLEKEYLSNNLKNDCSLINSLYLGHSRNDIKCLKCNKEKVIFENFTALCVPIPEYDIIVITVKIFRLSINHKLYILDKIKNNNLHKNSSNILRLKEIKNVDITEIRLTDMYDNEVEKEGAINFNDNLNLGIPLKLCIEVDRSKKIETIVDILKDVLDLEKSENSSESNTEILLLRDSNNEILINTFLDYDKKIDDYIQNFDEIVAYEILTAKGWKLLYDNNDKIENNYLTLRKKGITINNSNNSNKSNNDKETKSDENEVKDFEFIIQIVNRKIKEIKSEFFVNPFSFTYLNYDNNFLIFCKSLKVNPMDIYDNVLEKYEYLFKSEIIPWWHQVEMFGLENNLKSNNSKLSSPKKDRKNIYIDNATVKENACLFPFTIKIVNKNNFACAICPWYSFCSGCTLNPFSVEMFTFNEDDIIMIEWCVNAKLFMNKKKLLFMHPNVNKLIEKYKSEKTKDECSIKNCLDSYFQKEYFDEKNSLDCSTCKSKQKMVKETKLAVIPPILTIVLKRFKFTAKIRRKIEKAIKYPKSLNLSEYSIKTRNTEDQQESFEYLLNSIICHSGSLNSGHYYSYVNVEDKWINYNDSIAKYVDKSFAENNLTESCYILIYIRNNYSLTKDQNYKLILNLYKESSLLTLQDKNNLNMLDFFENEPIVYNNKEGFILSVNDSFIEIRIKNETIKVEK